MQLDIYLLSQKWKELVKKARAKQLQPNEYNSGMEIIALHKMLDHQFKLMMII
jgi:hypothetical protein